MVKYMVQLNAEERPQLLTLVSTGRAAAAKLLHARILLKAAIGVGERRWSDTAIADALDTSASTVPRVHQAWVAQGIEAALARKRPTGRQYRKLDGAQEAQVSAIACRAPPEGNARWTLKLLADKLVALDIVATIRTEWVRTTLKKTSSNHGSSSNG
jgi:transposase